MPQIYCFSEYNIPQITLVSGIVSRIPKLPAIACKSSTTIISVLNKSRVEELYATSSKVVERDEPMYARISVFAIVPRISLPITNPD